MVSGFCFSAVALAVRFGALAAVAAARARPCTQAAFVVLPCMLAVAVVFPWTPAVFAAHHPDTPAALAGFHLAVDFGAVVAAAGFAASSYCVCLVCVFSFRTPCAFSYFLFRGKMLQGRHIPRFSAHLQNRPFCRAGWRSWHFALYPPLSGMLKAPMTQSCWCRRRIRMGRLRP